MHFIPLIRSAGIIIFYGFHSSNASIIVRKSIELMHEIITTIIHTKSNIVAVYQNKKSQRIHFHMKCVFFS